MNWFGILILIGLYRVCTGIHKKAFHHHELLTFDALDRIGRWFMVVAMTWVLVAMLLRGLELLDVYSQLSVIYRPDTFKP
jgi:hypothetical protein